MRIRLKFLIWLCALISNICLFASEEVGSITYRIKPESERLHSWLQHGLLFYHHIPAKKGYYLYCGKDGYLNAILSLPQFSAMIREEVQGREELLVFIRERLPQVIFAFRGPNNAFLIDNEYLNYRKSIDPELWEGKDLRRSQILIQKYFSPKPVVDDSNWSCVFYATSRDGSIEKWNLRGKVHPFSVDYCTNAVVEKPGAIVPAPTTGIIRSIKHSKSQYCGSLQSNVKPPPRVPERMHWQGKFTSRAFL